MSFFCTLGFPCDRALWRSLMKLVTFQPGWQAPIGSEPFDSQVGSVFGRLRVESLLGMLIEVLPSHQNFALLHGSPGHSMRFIGFSKKMKPSLEERQADQLPTGEVVIRLAVNWAADRLLQFSRPDIFVQQKKRVWAVSTPWEFLLRHTQAFSLGRSGKMGGQRWDEGGLHFVSAHVCPYTLHALV